MCAMRLGRRQWQSSLVSLHEWECARHPMNRPAIIIKDTPPLKPLLSPINKRTVQLMHYGRARIFMMWNTKDGGGWVNLSHCFPWIISVGKKTPENLFFGGWATEKSHDGLRVYGQTDIAYRENKSGKGAMLTIKRVLQKKMVWTFSRMIGGPSGDGHSGWGAWTRWRGFHEAAIHDKVA